MVSLRTRAILICALALLPVRAWAQGAISGVVRDTAGAVLPGVNVEVASPALIEKVRSVVTDGCGEYTPITAAVVATLVGLAPTAARHDRTVTLTNYSKS